MVKPCVKRSTEAWLNVLHQNKLGHEETVTFDTCMKTGGGEGMDQVAVSMQKYTDVMEKDMKFKLEERKEKKKEKDEKGFNYLPQVNKCIILFSAAPDGLTQDKLDVAKPSEEVLKLIKCSNNIKVQSALHQ